MLREEALAYIHEWLKDEYALNSKDREALDMAIKALEQEPCEDCISRQAVLDAMYELCDTGETLNENPWRDNPHIDAIADAINNLPSVTPQPKIGHWIYDRTRDWDGECKYECSCCGMGSDVDYAYCMRCGAKMESEDKK